MDEYSKLTTADPSFKGMRQPYYYTALTHLDPEKSFKEAVLVKDIERNRSYPVLRNDILCILHNKECNFQLILHF